MEKSGYNIFSDDALLSAFKSGDSKAFEEIYKRYWSILFGIAFKQTSSKQDAEELVQNVFERIWKNRESLAIKNIGAYLSVSLRNVIVDYFRQKSVEKRFQNSQIFVDEGNLTEEEFNRVQLLNLIDNLLLELPEKTRMAFQLSRYDGKSIKEIAQELGLSQKAIEYHITVSMKHLKSFLKQYLAFFFFFNHWL